MDAETSSTQQGHRHFPLEPCPVSVSPPDQVNIQGPTVTARFCDECGASLVSNAKFCASCGKSISGNRPATPANPVIVDQHRRKHPDDPLTGSRPSASMTDSAGILQFVPSAAERRSKQLLIGIGALLLLILLLVLLFSYLSGEGAFRAGGADQETAAGTVNSGAEGGAMSVDEPDPLENYSDDYLSNTEQALYATGAANMRNFPTTARTRVLDTFSANDRIVGRWVRGLDETTRWLRIDGVGGTGYIWDGNLSSSEQPTRSWLIGFWAYDASCATDGTVFRRNGTFSNLVQSGRYELEGDRITESITIDHENDAVINPPIHRTTRIRRLADDRAEFIVSSGDSIPIFRC